MVITDENGKKKQSYFHDFFNYAGSIAAEECSTPRRTLGWTISPW
ncbi:hypothetical protein ACLB1E_21515 [Escherichia coli]